MRYLLDTNVLSEPARARPDATVLAWLESHPTLDLAISVLSLGEVRKGIDLLPASRRKEALESWFSIDLPRQFLHRVLPVDEAIAVAWGRITAEGRTSGRELPAVDGLLIATALVHGLTLVTRNERDCGGRGVPILNPWSG